MAKAVQVTQTTQHALGRHTYATLDGVRGVAALCVLLFHQGQQPGWAQHLPSGHLAVDIFFVLSGFIIETTYGPRFGSGLTPSRFMALRLIRLYPVYVICLAFGVTRLAFAPLAPHEFEYGPKVVISAVNSVLLLPMPVHIETDRNLFAPDGPAWSLSMEIWMNLVYVLAYRWMFLGKRKAYTLAAAVVGYALAVWFFGHTSLGWGVGNLAGGVARVFVGFTLGSCLSSMARPSARSDLGVVAVLCAVLAMLKLPTSDVWCEVLAVLFVAPAVVHFGAAWEPRSTHVRRSFLMFGALSYPLYLIHHPVLDWSQVFFTAHPGHGFPLRFVAAASVSISCAGVLAFVVDRPARKLLRRACSAASRALASRRASVAALGSP